MNQKALKACAIKKLEKYWESFRAGHSHNVMSSEFRWRDGDSWATEERWRAEAEQCIESGTNLYFAYEVLLTLDFDAIFPSADEFFYQWNKEGAFDRQYAYFAIAHFPRDHPLREKLLGRGAFHDVFAHDLDTSIARQALVRAGDHAFIERLAAKFVNEIQDGKCDSNQVERSLYLLEDLGADAEALLPDSALMRLESFLVEYWSRDQAIGYNILDPNLDIDRSLWIGDMIGYLSWQLGFKNIITDLFSSELYWDFVFSYYWGEDSANKNLLAWSTLESTEVLIDRAKAVMAFPFRPEDGAIATIRMLEKSESN